MANYATIDLRINRVVYMSATVNPNGVPQGFLELETTGLSAEVGWHYNTINDAVFPPPSWVRPVRCATTGAVTAITGLETGDVIDGITLATGDRVLLKDQSDASENGIYVLIGASGSPPRDTDSDKTREMLGLTVRVLEGTVNAGTMWTCTNATLGVALGSDDLVFARIYPAAGVYPVGSDGQVFTTDSSTGTDTSWVTPLNVQTFASSGTWTKPTSPKFTRAAIFICGPGGGGGSGRRGAASSIRNGGAGGGGGALAVVDIALSTLGSTETVTIGTGGAGGAAQTTNDTNGNAGAAGSASSTFGTALARAGAGAGGAGGDAVTGTAGAVAFPGLGPYSGGAGAGVRNDGAAGTAGGGTNVGTTNTLVAGVLTTLSLGASGGGSAGGITTANSGTGGGSGGNNLGFSATGVVGGTGGGAGSGQTAGTAGTAAPTGSTFGGMGGGGGASGASGAGSVGGAGGAPGGAGGGGGAAVNGANSGAGGAGANGYCAVVCY